jgi:cysteine desulfurase
LARHYLDHASTTPLRPQAVEAMRTWLAEAASGAADPGRVHEEGRVVRATIEEAREQVADLAGVAPRQVVFTSSGTEAINAAVWGAVRSRPDGVVLCADVEHSAVRDASARLANVETLAVDHRGRIDVAMVADRLARDDATPIALVHCQWANHEVGTLQPVAEIVSLCRAAAVPVHVDAAAAFGHLDTDPVLTQADLVSVSGHKLGGPPGIGALLIRRGVRIDPLLLGGQQERERRGGLENLPGIVGFGAAAGALGAAGGERIRTEAATARRQTDRLLASVRKVPEVTLVGDPDPSGRLPHLLCLGVAGVEAEPVLIGLDRAGVAAHSGSACSSESLEPSPVLEAMGEDPSHSLRLSVGWNTTDADLDAFAGAFPDVVGRLRELQT